MTNSKDKRGPLDGSTSGTIGGGGAESGGPTPRPDAPEAPPVRPEDAASGRRAPDPLAATHDLSDLAVIDVTTVETDEDRPDRAARERD
jgi:hypothetical protein